MMNSLIIVPFLLEPLLRQGLSRFSLMLRPYRNSLSFRHNDIYRL